MAIRLLTVVSFFFNDTATTEIYTLSLHDALPICCKNEFLFIMHSETSPPRFVIIEIIDRKSTRLNSSHQIISYAVFCLTKKTSSSLERSRAYGDTRVWPEPVPGKRV